MNKLFLLFVFLFICFNAFGQTIETIEICETKSAANIGKNRNEFLHSLSPPQLNNGYQHNITVPTLSPPPVCDAELTGILVKADITSYLDDLTNVNAANSTTCGLYGWFVDVLYDCSGSACTVIQQVNNVCNTGDPPIRGIGLYTEEMFSCSAAPTTPPNVINIDIVPAMEQPNANCPDICNAMPNGWVDVEYTLCIEFEFTVTDPPTAIASNTGPYCYDDDIELEVDENGFDYDWSGPNGFSSADQNPIITNATELDAGIYTVTVSSAPGCEVILTTEVEVGEEIIVTIVDEADPTCNGYNDGIAEVSASGGYGNYIFDWTDGFTGDYVDQLEGDISYQILVTDEEGCEGVGYIQLFEPDLLEIDLVDFTNPSCPGAMDGEADFFATGGDGTYDYDWNPGGYIDPVVSTLSGGITYNITVYDGMACEAYGSVTLTDPAPTTITFNNTGPFCLENTNQQITAMPTPGSFSGATDGSGNFNPSTLGVGTHRVYYDYPSGNCSVRDSIDIIITPPVAIVFGDSTFCQTVTSATLTATPTNGTWSGAGINPTTGEFDPSALGVGMHTFTYEYTDPSTNCVTTKNIMVEVEAQPNIMIMGDDDFCQSAGNQTFTATPTGGTWGGVVDNTGQVNASTLTVGSHDVTYSVTDGTCSNTSTYPINVTAPPTATMSGGGTICPGGTVDANLDFTLTGTGPWTIEFTLDAVAQIPINATGSPHQHSVSQPGTYAITSVTDASGCVGTVSGSATVTQITPLAISNVQTQCDPTNTNYVLTFEISGGDAATYMVTGVTGSISGTAPYIFTSQNIPQGTTTNFTVSDNSACAAVSDNVTVNCACATEVGSMDPTLISICGTGTAMGTYDNSTEALDGNDISQFVLHTNAGVSLGTIIATNGTPSFSFGGGIVYGTTYYISAIVGDDNGGNVDLNDPCLKIAQGTPVVFNEIPTAALSGGSTICEGESAMLTFTLIGTAPWNIQYSDGTNTIDLNGITTSPVDVTVMPTMTTNYTIVSVENSTCPGTVNGMATVTVNTPASATVTPATEVCNSAQSGNSTTLDFSTLITAGDMTGTWTDVDNSGATGTFPNLDFDNIAPGDYTFRYTTGAAQAPCTNISYAVTITVRDCACPSVLTTGAGLFCNNDARVDLTTMTLTMESGIWSILSVPTGSSATLTGSIFNANNSAAGDYELEFRLTNTVMGCPESSTQTIQIFEQPTATVTSTESVCNSSQSGDPTSFDFSTLITAGDMGGDWTDADNSGATGTFPNLDFDGVTPGDYLFRYATTSAQAPCVNSTYDVTITVRDCACPSVQTTGAGPFCNDAASLDLTTLTVTMESGTWSIAAAPTGSTATLSGNNFDANDSAAGDYELEFTLDNPVAGCPSSSTQTIQVFAPPSATVTTSAEVCNSSQSGDPTSFDFSTLITAGDIGGDWTDVDNSGATGTFPNLNFENIATGDYTFRYETNSAQAPCVNAMYDVTITVRDCACPSVLLTGAGPLCNDDARVDLTTLTLTSEPGTWSILSEPSGSTATIAGNNFDANGSPEGNYALEFTLDNPVAGCPESSTQTIQVFAPPSATITTSAEVCNSSQSGDPTTFDFDDLITAGDMTGTWIDVDNSGATGTFPNLDFDNIAVGDYTFRYTTNTAQAPCTEATYDVMITVRDCACPSVLTTGAGPLCNDNAAIDLTDLTLTMEAGTWSILSAPSNSMATITGNNFNINNSSSGDYELEFTLNMPVAGCPSSSTQTIEIVAAPSAGDLIQDWELCEGVDTLISLFDLIENFDMGGNWVDNSLNPVTSAFDPAAGTFISNGVSVNTYVFEYLVDGGGVCNDASTTVEITVNANPTADAGMDREINCDDTEVMLGGSSTTGAQYSWSGTVDAPSAATTTTSRPDTYVLTVTNAAGCSATDEVIVTVSSDFPLLDASAIPIDCFGDNDGVIQVNNVSGGLTPYMFSFDGGAFTDQNTFTNLEPGIYSLVLEDANGCKDSTNFEILEPNEFSVTLSVTSGNGSNIIQFGDSTQLTAVGSSAIDSISWSPTDAFDICDPIIAPSCLSQWVSPETVTTYSIVAFNEDGCNALADITLQVENTEDGVFTPDAFSPNDDGINDIFMPFTDQTVAVIKSFMVYDRWGEPVHKFFNIEPNDISGGWDGKFKGKRLNTGVFVWFAELEYKNGATKLFEGDVTLLR